MDKMAMHRLTNTLPLSKTGAPYMPPNSEAGSAALAHRDENPVVFFDIVAEGGESGWMGEWVVMQTCDCAAVSVAAA